MSIDTTLAASIGKLNEGQKILLLEMTNYMQLPIDFSISPDSDIASKEFSENLMNRLLIHHATNEEKFKKKSFEFAFAAASRADGKDAEIVDNQTFRGADVIVAGTKFSLKTEASAGIRPTAITISKLMEARWIRDYVSNEDIAEQTSLRIRSHLQEYERILILRAFSCGGDKVTYELVEIPKDVLLAAANLKAHHFGKRTNNGSNSAEVAYMDRTAFRLRLDGSVEKVTVSGLRKSLCKVHGQWTIPALIKSAD